MNIYHFCIWSGPSDCSNWIAVADDVEIAKEKIIAQWCNHYDQKYLNENIENLKKILDEADLDVYSLNDAFVIYQSFD